MQSSLPLVIGAIVVLAWRVLASTARPGIAAV
jgi:hypothetical protein